MKSITDIYEEYKIMPNLQLHQLRVAAVASMICDSLDISVEKGDIVTACLLHDMGNIIKAKLHMDLFPMTNEEKAYWKNVKKEYLENYGTTPSEATSKIIKEIGVSESIVQLVENNDFKDICDISHSDSLNKKILKYSDLRVGPHSIVSIDGRFEDLTKRYAALLDGDRKDCALNLEKQIFSHSSIKPEDITDESVKANIESLKYFAI